MQVNAVAGTTIDNFNTAMTGWLGKYFEDTAFHDQKQYFLGATKAYSMTVKATATCVEQIIRYMAFMPGAPAAGGEIYSPLEKKMVFYRLMRPSWRTNFDASGHRITDPAYDWDMLVRYMGTQETRENRVASRRDGGRGGRSGRGQRGGRGGRSGRGSSYTRQSSYQGGPPSQRYRTGYSSGRGRGYSGRYGSGYGNQGGYQTGSSGSSPSSQLSYGGNAYVPRAPVGGRLHGGRGGRVGRGRLGAAARGALNACGAGTHSTRSGHVYMANETNDTSGRAESFESGAGSEETGPDFQEQYHEPYYEEEVYYGEEEEAYGGFDDYDYYGYGDDLDHYGEY